MAKKITAIFYGASDDLLIMEASDGRELQAHVDEKPEHFIVRCGSEGIRVTGLFGAHGTWCLGVSPLDEVVRLPPWQIIFNQKNSASPGLVLVLPSDATIEQEIVEA